jgi:hypothetical protein
LSRAPDRVPMGGNRFESGRCNRLREMLEIHNHRS